MGALLSGCHAARPVTQRLGKRLAVPDANRSDASNVALAIRRTRALRTVEPVATNPSATQEQVLAVERELRVVHAALTQHCKIPGNFFVWLYAGVR